MLFPTLIAKLYCTSTASKRAQQKANRIVYFDSTYQLIPCTYLYSVGLLVSFPSLFALVCHASVAFSRCDNEHSMRVVIGG